MVDNFKIALFEIAIKAGEKGLSLPPYKGSTFRGGFGSAFRRIVCSQKNMECKECLLKENCPYAYIFETSPPTGAQALRKYENIPRPFVIEPPLEEKTEYQPGELMVFNLILIGRAIKYLPYFIVVFRELGSIGIGKGRKKFKLLAVNAFNSLKEKKEQIYSAKDELVHNVDLTINSQDLFINTDIKQLKINYLTMTRLKYEQKFVGKIEFHILIRNLLRRISSLYYFHHDLELDVDYKGLIESAREIKIISDNTRWVEWERYSNRQDTRMSLGGVLGEVIYEGELNQFWTLLKLGELVHVGKATTFGMGKYKLEII